MEVKITYQITEELQKKFAVEGESVEKLREITIETQNSIIIGLCTISQAGSGEIDKVRRKIDIENCCYGGSLSRIIESERDFIDYYFSKTEKEIEKEQEAARRKIEKEKKNAEEQKKEIARRILCEEIANYKKTIEMLKNQIAESLQKTEDIENKALIEEYSTGEEKKWNEEEYNDEILEYAEKRELGYSIEDTNKLEIERWTGIYDNEKFLLIRVAKKYYLAKK